jgi:glutathione-specific gamma-glutamylcyclotransferase
MSLTREKIQAGWVRQMVASGDGRVHALTDAELAASRASCLARLPVTGDVWLFGYGSLIWNPCFDFAEQRIAKVMGWHRRFCLWTNLGRGTVERPGLMLGLERGGACRGLAFRVPQEAVECELDIVWRREMVTAAYVPTVVTLATPEGRLRAIAFTINRSHERYAGGLDEERTIEALATAEGPLGTNRDYLFNTVQHLRELGLRDRALERLAKAVEQLQCERRADAFCLEKNGS